MNMWMGNFPKSYRFACLSSSSFFLFVLWSIQFEHELFIIPFHRRLCFYRYICLAAASNLKNICLFSDVHLCAEEFWVEVWFFELYVEQSEKDSYCGVPLLKSENSPFLRSKKTMTNKEILDIKVQKLRTIGRGHVVILNMTHFVQN